MSHTGYPKPHHSWGLSRSSSARAPTSVNGGSRPSADTSRPWSSPKHSSRTSGNSFGLCA